MAAEQHGCAAAHGEPHGGDLGREHGVGDLRPGGGVADLVHPDLGGRLGGCSECGGRYHGSLRHAARGQ
jgi:hypothetical protein